MVVKGVIYITKKINIRDLKIIGSIGGGRQRRGSWGRGRGAGRGRGDNCSSLFLQAIYNVLNAVPLESP